MEREKEAIQKLYPHNLQLSIFLFSPYNFWVHSLIATWQSSLLLLIISSGDTPSYPSMNPTIWLILDTVSDSLCSAPHTMGQKDYHGSLSASLVFLEQSSHWQGSIQTCKQPTSFSFELLSNSPWDVGHDLSLHL